MESRSSSAEETLVDSSSFKYPVLGIMSRNGEASHTTQRDATVTFPTEVLGSSFSSEGWLNGSTVHYSLTYEISM
mgnify:CR=1 FL=1